MSNILKKELTEVDEIKCYLFSWKLTGYDSGPPKIRSPIFTVNFQVTEWYMELDLSNLQNINSSIPFRLQRIPDVGPNAITFDVKITVKLGENKDFSLEKSQTAKVFSETTENYWAFDIDIPFQKLESKGSDEIAWLNPKCLSIDVEMKSTKMDLIFPKMYSNSLTSLIEVLGGLKKLHEGLYHDLVLKVSGEELHLHKWFLNVRWPKLMSTLQISESSEEVETKEISGIPPNVLKVFIRFAYLGDLYFMYNLEKINGGKDVFDLVKKYNFYRLNDKITHLSPKCCSSQFLQSYRTTFEMKFKNVTATEMAMADFRTCEIPLKPEQLPQLPEMKNAKEKEKFQQHIRFLDLKVYVDKGPFGYNWLMFSIVLGKLPKESAVIIKVKLYVVGENELKYLLSEQNLVFDASTEISFSTSVFPDKVCKRYRKISEPVITLRELTDESRNFMRKRKITFMKSSKILEEKDLCFRFELKLADGEHICDTRHGECLFKSVNGDYKIYKDLELIYKDDKFTDIKVTSGDRSIKAHKAILAARSEVLDTIFREKPNLKSVPINIQPDILHIFLHYIYTGQLHEVPNDKISELLSVAEEYKMKCLQDILNNRKKLQKLLVVIPS